MSTLRQDEQDEMEGTQMIEQSEHVGFDGPNYIIDAELGIQYDPETGEVKPEHSWELPDDVTELGQTLGERIATGEARLAGLVAAKASWTERINEMFDARINQTRRAVEWMRTNPAHVEPLRVAAELVRANTGKQSATIGLVKCKFTKSRESLEVVGEAWAVTYLEEHYPAAVKITKSVIKSIVPDDIKALCNDDNPETGMRLHPAGETERFEVI